MDCNLQAKASISQSGEKAQGVLNSRPSLGDAFHLNHCSRIEHSTAELQDLAQQEALCCVCMPIQRLSLVVSTCLKPQWLENRQEFEIENLICRCNELKEINCFSNFQFWKQFGSCQKEISGRFREIIYFTESQIEKVGKLFKWMPSIKWPKLTPPFSSRRSTDNVCSRNVVNFGSKQSACFLALWGRSFSFVSEQQ